MHPIQNMPHVEHRIRSLHDEAAVERAVRRQRRVHDEEHRLHRTLGHAHENGSVRTTVGRALIALGAAIAGEREADVRRAA